MTAGEAPLGGGHASGRVGGGGGIEAGWLLRKSAAAQVFVDDPAAPALDPEQEHHLGSVLRLRTGELVVASDGRGTWSACRFRRSPRPGTPGPAVRLEPDSPLYHEPPAAPTLTVAFAPVKGDRPEWVVEKLTELGVDRIVPLATERSVVRWDRGRAERICSRLRKIAGHSAAQSRRVWLPELTSVLSLPELAAAIARDGHELLLAEPGGQPIATLGAPVTAVAVGPEGGWSPAELAMGFRTIALSRSVLRSDTAAVTAGAIAGALRSRLVMPAPPSEPPSEPGSEPAGRPVGENGGPALRRVGGSV